MVRENLRGEITRISFSNPETGFTVAEVMAEGHMMPVTVVGNLGSVFTGQVLHMQGQWEMHPRFGKRFNVQAYSRVLPKSKRAIKRYLSSGLIDGIGPALAKRIVKRFGEDTLKIIDDSPKELLKVKGIGPKRLELIKRAWEEQKEISSAMVLLKEHGLGTALSFKIIKRYGNNALSVITEDPYRLARDMPGVGFKTADKIAQEMGLSRSSNKRIEAGIVFSLATFAEKGHVYYPLEALIRSCRELLGVDEVEISRSVSALARNGEVVIDEVDEPEGERTRQRHAVYLRRYYSAEKGIAAHVKRLTTGGLCTLSIDTRKAIEWVKTKIGIELVARQIEAVAKALRHKLLIITGGPGTGKTTIIRAIAEIYRAKKAVVLLAAPTGRASKRMEEATGMEAKTIHRLLEFSWEKGGFGKDENNPLQADLVIVDEASMIDVSLMFHLLRAMPTEAGLVLVGDVDQLPPVGPGNVLRDMINSGTIPVVQLTEIFRQARKSLITVNAHRINQGQMPVIPSRGQGLRDFYLIEQDEPQEVQRTMVELVCNRIPNRFSLDPKTDIQVLCPMHRGIVGTQELNQVLQRALNPHGQGIQVGSKRFSVGDKVMQIRNDYEKEVFNGDIGYVDRVDKETGQIVVQFESRKVRYRLAELDDLTLAYAISVHKSQGSEYMCVVLPLVSHHYLMLQRNLLYTAVTRARILSVIVGSKKALQTAISNERPSRRYTLLAKRLKGL